MPDLGTKHECTECGAKFYDLNKPEPTCPKCGTVQPPNAESSLGTSKSAKRRQKAELVSDPELEEDDAAETVAVFDDDDLEEDEDEIDEEDLADFDDEDEEEEEEFDDD